MFLKYGLKYSGAMSFLYYIDLFKVKVKNNQNVLNLYLIKTCSKIKIFFPCNTSAEFRYNYQSHFTKSVVK